jgi:hypothetical protein
VRVDQACEPQVVTHPPLAFRFSTYSPNLSSRASHMRR